MTENKSRPVEFEDDDILTESIRDWEESIQKLHPLVEQLKAVAVDQESALFHEVAAILDELSANLHLARIGEAHAANLLTIATSNPGGPFSPAERDLAANGARILLGFPVVE